MRNRRILYNVVMADKLKQPRCQKVGLIKKKSLKSKREYMAPKKSKDKLYLEEYLQHLRWRVHICNKQYPCKPLCKREYTNRKMAKEYEEASNRTRRNVTILKLVLFFLWMVHHVDMVSKVKERKFILSRETSDEPHSHTSEVWLFSKL